jgi:hypothetical protein
MEDIKHCNTRANPNIVLDDNKLRDKTIGMNPNIATNLVSSLQHRVSANTDIITDSVVLSYENTMPRPQAIPDSVTSIDNRVGTDNSIISDNKLAYFAIFRINAKQNVLAYEWIAA